MDYFPIFVATQSRKVLFIGTSVDVTHKIRLLLKTSADLHVFGCDDVDEIITWQDQGVITLHRRALTAKDIEDAAFAFIDGDDETARDEAMQIFDAGGLNYSVIDDQSRSTFITPALVDRDPVVVAIGTEGTSPIIARDTKSKIEAILPIETGMIAKIAGQFRGRAAALPKGYPRRQFWSRYLNEIAPKAIGLAPDACANFLKKGLNFIFEDTKASQHHYGHLDAQHHVHAVKVIEISSNDPDLLTRGASKILHDADMVVHDGDIAPHILELSRREARRLLTNRSSQDQTVKNIKTLQQNGTRIVYLKSAGNPGISDDAVFTHHGISIEDVTGYLTPPHWSGLDQTPPSFQIKEAS